MMRVLKRDNTYEPISFDKVLRRIRNLCQNLKGVSPDEIAQKVCARIYDGVKTSELDELAAQLCASLLTSHPDYGFLASRIIISNHHKNTSPSFSETMSLLFNAKDIHGTQNSLISQELWDIVKSHKSKLNSVIDYQRDFLFDYFGFKTLERSYLLKVDGKIVERPQHMWMRVALGIHGSDIKEALETYEYMSQRYFTHATPTLFNAGTPRAQLASCFLLGTHDSITGIFKTVGDSAQISKYAGGIGIHIHDIRATGSHIRGTNGNSTGIVPMLRVYNNTARYVNQGGKRNGSIAMYLEPWHADIDAFLDIRKNHGSEEDRCRDLFTAMWIPDLFMKRVQENGEWSLMCPDECRGLSDAVGDEFEVLYQKYEAEGKFRKKIKAQQLWMAILKSQIETGTPYICYKDAANKKSNQKNLGTIKSSNLCSEIIEFSNNNSYATCLTGETKILTENGLKRIDECNNETVLSYFSDDKNLIKKPTFVKSELINNGEKEVYSISFLNSRKITATKDHLFLIRTGRKQSIKSDTYEWIKLENIKKGDNIVLPANDVLPGYDIDIKINVDDEYAVAGWMIGDGWQRAVKENNSDTITLNYGVCFGKYDDYAKDKVVPILNNIQQTQQSICERSIKEYTDKKGTTYWQTKQYSFAKYFKDKYGFEEHLGPAKIIPNKIHNSSPNMKASFLSGLFSADGTVFIQSHFNVSLSSASIELLYEVQEMLRCFGIHSKVQYSYIKSRDRSQGNVIIHGIQNIKRFLKYIGFTLSPTKQEKLEKGINTFNYERNRSINEYITVSNIEYAGKQQVYDLHVPETHNFIANGVISHNCNLASIALPSYVKYDENGKPSYDFKKLHEIAQVITRNINKVIDRTFYPVPETETNNKQHRPIGIGVQGLANTFALMRMPFDSPEAAQLNKDIFETIYHGALTASMLIAKRRDEMRTELDTAGIVLKRKRELMKYLQLIPEEIALTKYRGAYSSFDGSPASQGQLQFDLWGEKPDGILWNWEELKGEIVKYGIRNSLLLAPMPTASTSQILGFNESIEPFTSNIYQRQTLAGEFVIINKHLIQDLLDAGLWNTDMKNRVFMAGGSIQGIEEIPENIRALYKTAWEMKQKVLIDQAADRGIYVCQSQSLNLFVEDPEFSKLSNMHFYGWKRGLKTGVYYLRTRPRAKISAFTIEPPKMVNTTSSQDIGAVVGSSNINAGLPPRSSPNPSPKRTVTQQSQQSIPIAEPPTEEQIMACRRDNPEGCLMCGS
jgi:ribonucleoside-diphosphate reductase alpha chain